MRSDLPNLPYLGRYILYLLGGIALMAVANAALRAVFDFGGTSGASTVLPPMIAAMLVGQKWAKDTGAAPEMGRVWRLSLAGAIFHVLLQAVLGVIVFSAMPSVDGLGIGILFGVVAIVGVMTIFVNRWFIGMGAKNHLKYVERQ